ncbi:TraR/DksA C4-type zinc finger protein [Billgrantia aerodenitrificans]|uniref:TraR/DksA family transcriptional regulator n=1 Tax=Billgrantia aerodenitrificans TaxID=2733483 RepID=A0ABS9APM2_9GAMM|nr:TraR/DksA C4-type zinc finger protein [Halomonas aerodenitrificans]MCE8023643.1 TraR/DksA family transcriptional regulator [Halomonas aerodenitrificans]
MADNADIATELMERRLAGALASRQRPSRIVILDPECEDCGYEIPAARRQAAPWATTCIECQGIREQRAAQRR